MLSISFERPGTNEAQKRWRFHLLFCKLPSQCPLLGNKIHVSALLISENTYFLCGQTACNYLLKWIIWKINPSDVFCCEAGVSVLFSALERPCRHWIAQVHLLSTGNGMPARREEATLSWFSSRKFSWFCRNSLTFFCARADNGSVFPQVQMACGHAEHQECKRWWWAGRTATTFSPSKHCERAKDLSNCPWKR